MGDVQCPACKARTSLVVGLSLRIWQNAQGTLLQVELQCPSCGRLEQVPIKTRLILGADPLHLRELALPTNLQGQDDVHRPDESNRCPGWCRYYGSQQQCPTHHLG
jgi:RNase P subunit RPR2